MKLSDYVIDHLARIGVSHLFGMSGGAAVHLFDSADRHPGMVPVFSQHEQSSAMSADGYARITGRLGVAVTTSGPGATNLLTGVCCSYYDSIPTLMLTGQVATHRLKGERAIRQFGFQETDVLSIFGTVTKYAVQIRDPASIRYHLEKACHLAFAGRPGSVLVDIPDDLQRAEVDPDGMEAFAPPSVADPGEAAARAAEEVAAWAAGAERPVLVLGGGLSSPRLGEALERLVDRLGWPVLQTWAALDLLPAAHPMRIGPFGVYGPRLGNFTIQNADRVLCLGTRLSQNVTGAMLDAFARGGRLAMVDAEPGEMDKFDGRGLAVDLRVAQRLDLFVPALDAALGRRESLSPCDAWHKRIDRWRQVLPDDRPAPPADEAGRVDAHRFVDALSAALPDDEAIFVDTGGNLTWTCNGIRLRPGQRLVSAWNNTPMGYALPAAIGAAVVAGSAGVTCIIGDGGLMLCMGELATLVRRKLPVKVIVFDNRGHGIQRQTLDTWLGGRNVGVDEESGLAFAEFPLLGPAFGLPTSVIDRDVDMPARLAALYATPGPALCIVRLPQDQRLHPFLKFGAPLEDQSPALTPATLAAEMVIPPYEPGSIRPAAPSVGL